AGQAWIVDRIKKGMALGEKHGQTRREKACPQRLDAHILHGAELSDLLAQVIEVKSDVKALIVDDVVDDLRDERIFGLVGDHTHDRKHDKFAGEERDEFGLPLQAAPKPSIKKIRHISTSGLSAAR